jgi:2-polyprenyl-3-methyl-5-hydroxy-6-metoxy-1,4-benzoquinol methylase
MKHMERQAPNPALIFETITAYQKAAALATALDLGLFTAIGAGYTSAEAIATHTQASVRGIRSLCDYLTVHGFLNKTALPPDPAYALTLDAAAFLDEKSPAYLGSIRLFLSSGDIKESFNKLTAAVRQGRTALAGQGSVDFDDPVWQDFARAMMPITVPSAQFLAQRVAQLRPCRVLDVAASHGSFGMAIARTNPAASVMALDFPGVLPVTRENVAAAGLNAQFSFLPGDIFQAELGGPYDIVLLANLLHHFSPERNTDMLRRIRAVLAPGGRVMTLEFVPNADRITPPASAAFSLVMLASTVEGDAYTFAEFERMFQAAGFPRNEIVDVPQSMQQLITSYVN